MRSSRRIRRAAVLLVAALAAAGTGIAGGLPAAAAVPPTAATPLTARQSVWLPTGDVVSYDPAHPAQVRVRTRAAAGVGHSWRAFEKGGDLYVFPLTAAPFLGTVLDTSLFDVTALAKSPTSPTVHVTAAGGAAAAVPGLTVTASSSGTQAGHFTHAGARVFGAALQKAAGRTSRATGLQRSLFGASSISGTSGGGPIVPQFQQQTVIFKAIGADGKPLPDGFLFYGNLDDAARGSDFAEVVDGEVRVSLPAGHFTLYSEADTFTDATSESRIVTQPNLLVTGARNQTVTIDFRTATAVPSVRGPRPTVLTEQDVIYDREWETGGFTALFFGDSSSTVRVAPAPAPERGTASLQTNFVRTGTGAGTPTLYDTYFAHTGAISANQAHTVTQAQLARVDERIHTDRAGKQEYFGHGVIGPDGSGFGSFAAITTPLLRADYLLAPAGFHWSDVLLAAPTSDDPFNGEVDDGLRSYAPGSRTTADWQRQLVGPSVPAFTPADIAAGVACPACRVTNELVVATVPFQDSAPDGHYGFVVDPATGALAAHARLYRNGTLIDDEPGRAFVDAAVPPGKASYRVVVDSTPSVAGVSLGTAARTAWTFSSAARSGGALPSTWFCAVEDHGDCTILPLLRVVAPLPADLGGGMSVGAHPFEFTVAPIQGAPATKVRATLRLSFDGGDSFTRVPVTALGSNRFRAVIVNPASALGTAPTVEVRGTDAAGGTVVESVRAAYRVTAK